MDITELREYEQILSPIRTNAKPNQQSLPINISDSPTISLVNLCPPEQNKSITKGSFDGIVSIEDTPHAIVADIVDELFEKIFPIKRALTTVIFDPDKAINTAEFNKEVRSSLRGAPSRLTHCIKLSNSVCCNKLDEQYLIPEPNIDDKERIEVKVVY